MKQQIKRLFGTAIIALFPVLTFMSCTKDPHSKPSVDYSKAPRKPAPDIMVGNWVHTEVSSTNIVDQYGHSVPAYMLGNTFHIEADGKGFQALTSTINTYTSSNKEDVNTDGTYEIDRDGDNIIFRYYPIQGEVWDNDHFSHALASEKCYPATYTLSECMLGEDSQGIYFEINESGNRYHKQQ